MWTLEQKSSCSLCLILFSFIALCLFASLLCCCHNSDRCQSKKLHVAALNPNNSALKLLTHYCYQSNISNCQLWEMFDCSWWQFASCLSWLLCINIPPSNPPRHIPPSAPVLPLLSGLPDVALLPLLALSAHVPGRHPSNKGRLGDKHQSFWTLDVGLVRLFVASRLHVCLDTTSMWCK